MRRHRRERLGGRYAILTGFAKFRGCPFVPDSLKRLSSAQNPESGTISYSYDANGNVLVKGDARTATFISYDPLNRPLMKFYSDTTPIVTYCYDAPPPGDQTCAGSTQPGYIGRLTQSSNASATMQYTAFDDFGRVLSSQQQMVTASYVFGYTYDLAGNLLTATLPSNHVQSYTYDISQPLTVTETVPGNNTATTTTVASGVAYAAHGGMTSVTLGAQGGSALVEQTSYNPRLQTSAVTLGGLLNLSYDYGSSSGVNNGNVLTQTIGNLA